MNEIFTNKTTVDITVVKLGNQKLTKSILNQIELLNPFDDGNIAHGIKILGYVNHKLKDSVKNVLFIYDSKLYYFPFSTLEKMATIKDRLKFKEDQLFNFKFIFFKNYKSNNFFYWDDNSRFKLENYIKDIFTEEELFEINKAQINLKNLLDELNDRLIIV